MSFFNQHYKIMPTPAEFWTFQTFVIHIYMAYIYGIYIYINMMLVRLNCQQPGQKPYSKPMLQLLPLVFRVVVVGQKNTG